MKDEGVRSEIQHRLADLRAAYPRISGAHAVLEDWREGREHRYALRLDVRLPQHQSLVSGGARDSAQAAVRAALDAASERMASLAARRT